jgi:hypothetical protein
MFNYCIYNVFNKNLLRKNFFYVKKFKLTDQKLANQILIFKSHDKR